MPDYLYNPPLPVRPPDEPVVQEIQLTAGDERIGFARWHAPAGKDGVVQLLDLIVRANHRRQRHGTRLMREVMNQCQAHLKRRKVKPRRLWLAVEHKAQITARAFLTQLGFHHVSTIENLLIDQESLIYVYSFD